MQAALDNLRDTAEATLVEPKDHPLLQAIRNNYSACYPMTRNAQEFTRDNTSWSSSCDFRPLEASLSQCSPSDPRSLACAVYSASRVSLLRDLGLSVGA
ncbi:protein of unknown function (plasmid) [Caballeronia sp. S22]